MDSPVLSLLYHLYSGAQWSYMTKCDKSLYFKQLV